jgi:DNA-binding response OmpR family regulator
MDPTAGGSFADLILMDIDLGNVTDGLQAAAEIRATVQIPIIFLSGRTDVMDGVVAQRPLGFLAKPYSSEQLASILRPARRRLM